MVVALLKENAAGAKVDALCRREGVSTATFYAWRKKFGGMGRSQLSELKALEKEMYTHAKNLEFEDAARLRDEIKRLQRSGVAA